MHGDEVDARVALLQDLDRWKASLEVEGPAVTDTEFDIREFLSELGEPCRLVDVHLGAIHAVNRGEEYFSEEIAARLAEIRKADELSARQVEVLGWLAKGFTNREIGDQMGISEDGVKAHLKNIFSILHAADRTEAVALAIHCGYLRED